jgi:hypothetical protein
MRFEDNSRLAYMARLDSIRYTTGAAPTRTLMIPLTSGRGLRIRLDSLDNLKWEGLPTRPLSVKEIQDIGNKLVRFVEEKGGDFTIDTPPSISTSAVVRGTRARSSFLSRLRRALSKRSRNSLEFEDDSTIEYQNNSSLIYCAFPSVLFRTHIPTTADPSGREVYISLDSLETLEWEQPFKRRLSIEEREDLKTKLVRFVENKGKPFVLRASPG